MNDTPETGSKGRAATAMGWLLVLPIAVLFLKERQGVLIGSYAESPGKAVFTGVPLVASVLLSFLLSRIAKNELPEQRGQPSSSGSR